MKGSEVSIDVWLVREEWEGGREVWESDSRRERFGDETTGGGWGREGEVGVGEEKGEGGVFRGTERFFETRGGVVNEEWWVTGVEGGTWTSAWTV